MQLSAQELNPPHLPPCVPLTEAPLGHSASSLHPDIGQVLGWETEIESLSEQKSLGPEAVLCPLGQHT